MFLATQLSRVKPSPSLAAKVNVDRLRAEGKKIIDFTIGEPDLPTPKHIVASAITALNSGATRYTNSAGIEPLRQAVVNKLERENRLAYQANEIVIGCGAKQIIACALAATLNVGDEVIIPAPYWVSYPDMVMLNQGVPITLRCPAENGFKLTAEQLEHAITQKTKWLILNTPNNPTGAVYSRPELLALAEVLKKYPHVMILADEIYEHFVYPYKHHLSLLNVAPELKDRMLLVNGLSKSYAFTGWRIGYGAGSIWLMKAINLLLSQSTTCANAVAQIAATTALNGEQHCVNEIVAIFRQRRDLMVERLKAIKGITCVPPEGAFYVFPSVKKLIGKKTPTGSIIASDIDVMNYFLHQANVAVIDGTSYGFPDHVRMSFATSTEQIEMGCQALFDAIELLGD